MVPKSDRLKYDQRRTTHYCLPPFWPPLPLFYTLVNGVQAHDQGWCEDEISISRRHKPCTNSLASKLLGLKSRMKSLPNEMRSDTQYLRRRQECTILGECKYLKVRTVHIAHVSAFGNFQ